jgi:hypothetical protein
VSDEWTTLETFLDQYRDVIVRKVDGLSEEDARRRLVPSATTPGGIVKHLRWVEFGWFRQLLGDRAGTHQRAHDRMIEFTVMPHDSVDELVAGYRAACAESRRVAAGYALDDTVPHDTMGPVSLRWIYVHLIEETARHAGQLDILREQIDGATG